MRGYRKSVIARHLNVDTNPESARSLGNGGHRGQERRSLATRQILSRSSERLCPNFIARKFQQTTVELPCELSYVLHNSDRL